MPEPGELALGKMPGIPLQKPDCLLIGKLILQISGDFLVSQTLHGNVASGDSLGQEPLHLVYEAFLHHLVNAGFNTFI
ncbi:hypothetical protein D3C76_1403200 [compost metagenome]